MPDTDEKVVFIMPDGSEVSNDPRFEREKLEEQILAARANLGDTRLPSAKDYKGEDGEPEDSEDSEDQESDGLDDMTAEELKAEIERLASEGVEVDTTGVKKKAELVERIRAAQA